MLAMEAMTRILYNIGISIAVRYANILQDETVANSSILRLYTLKEWCEEVMKDESLRTGSTDRFFDQIFNNEMNLIVHEAYKHYEA